MNTNECICLLVNSFEKQLTWYFKLNAIGESILQHLIFHHTDIQALMKEFEEKYNLIESITKERSDVGDAIVYFENNKNTIESISREVFDNLLEKIEGEIKKFITIESQIEKYIHYVQNTAAQQCR